MTAEDEVMYIAELAPPTVAVENSSADAFVVCFLLGVRLHELRDFYVTHADFASSNRCISVISISKQNAGAEVLLSIRREFNKSIEWILTGYD